MENGVEKKVLDELASRELMKKSEIVDFLRDKTEEPEKTVAQVVRDLVFKGLATNLTPAGESCIAITQKGMRASRQ
jgi:predicted transcriptional regulator